MSRRATPTWIYGAIGAFGTLTAGVCALFGSSLAVKTPPWLPALALLRSGGASLMCMGMPMPESTTKLPPDEAGWLPTLRLMGDPRSSVH
jgi:hypothetical protein